MALPLCQQNAPTGRLRVSSESSSVGRARPCQGRGRGFEPRLSLPEKGAADAGSALFHCGLLPPPVASTFAALLHLFNAVKALITKELLQSAVAESLSVAQVITRLGLVPAGGNYKTIHAKIAEFGLDTSHFTGSAWNVGARYRKFGKSIALSEILVEHSTYNFTHGLKTRLIKEGVKAAVCGKCRRSEWLGFPIPLELHHVNGVNNDHRLENLQILCPNCHALTDSYRGKNQARSQARVV